VSVDLARRMHELSNTLASREARDLVRGAACVLMEQAKQPDNQPFWIVMAMDKLGPVEVRTGGLIRQPDEATAKKEARRLAGEYGGRFAVLRAMHVIGWQEVQMDAADLQLPF